MEVIVSQKVTLHHLKYKCHENLQYLSSGQNIESDSETSVRFHQMIRL
jgi:hypothetical protein